MSNITEYQNLIELLRLTLEFYGNQENYGIPKIPIDPGKTLITADGGLQARIALEKIKEFNKNRTDSMEEYIKNVEETLEGNDNVDDLYKTLNELKRITNENK